MPVLDEPSSCVTCTIPELGAFQTYLYAVRRRDTREIKIGITQSPRARLAVLQTAHGAPLELVMAVPVHPSAERVAHERFAADRLMGEWFRETPAILAWVEEELAQSSDLPTTDARRLVPCSQTTTQGRPCAVPGNCSLLVRVAGADDGFLWPVCTQHLTMAMRDFARQGLTCSDPRGDYIDGVPHYITRVRELLREQGDAA